MGEYGYCELSMVLPQASYRTFSCVLCCFSISLSFVCQWQRLTT